MLVYTDQTSRFLSQQIGMHPSQYAATCVHEKTQLN